MYTTKVPVLYIGLVTIVLFCGLLAGSYPALYLSSLKPLDTMKGIINKNPVAQNSEESCCFPVFTVYPAYYMHFNS